MITFAKPLDINTRATICSPYHPQAVAITGAIMTIMTPEVHPDAETIASLQEKINKLEAALNQNNLDIAVSFGLTPALSNLLGLLLALPLVTAEAIQQHLEIATDRKVAICRLRKHMREWHERLGLAAEAVLVHGRRHMGYWIEPADKERIRNLVYEKIGLPAEVTEGAVAA